MADPNKAHHQRRSSETSGTSSLARPSGLLF